MSIPEKPSQPTAAPSSFGGSLGFIREYLFPSKPQSNPDLTPTAKLFSQIPGTARILVAGLDGSGKSTLLRQHICSKGAEGIRILKPAYGGIELEAVKEGRISFIAHDLGRTRWALFRRFDRALFVHADAVVYMIDCSDHERMAEAREELVVEGLTKKNGICPDTPLLILANKYDIEGASSPDQVETLIMDDISERMQDRPCRIFTTNMLTGDGIDEAFTWLSENLANHIHQHPIEQEQRSSWFGPLSPREPIERDIYGEVFVLLNKSILKDKERR